MSELTIARIQQEKDHLQKAQFIHQYRNNHKLSIKSLSKALNMQPSYVCHYLRLLKLPSIVVDGYYGKMVSATHLYIIARLKTQEEIQEAYEQVLAQNLTSQQTEELVREKLYGIGSSTDRLSKEEIKDFVRDMATQNPGVKLTVTQTRIKGKILLEVKGDTGLTTQVINDLLHKLIMNSQELKKNSRKITLLE